MTTQKNAGDANIVASILDTTAGAAGADKAAETTNPDAVDLDTPIERGATQITRVVLRRPKAGELRGTSLSELAALDVAALQKVLPRISTPTLTEFEVGQMDPADLMKMGGVFAGFLLSKQMKASMESQIA